MTSPRVNPLKELRAAGQAPWLDYLKRSFIHSGALKRMVEEDGLTGVTSNPSIFQKAIGDSDEYADAVAAVLAGGDRSIDDIYASLVAADIQAAADVLKPVYEETGGRDGYVSLECSPYLADDTEATVAEGLRLWRIVGRPNLMVKVPATPAGIPAVQRLIGEGVNVNITLLFAVSAYEAVVEAYLQGLEHLRAHGGDVSRVASVASFFISRIDTAVNKRLDGVGPRASALRGKIAIANAKVAYERYGALFSGPRWDALAAAGARTQRLLWASTSTKDPAFKDTLYVEALVGEDTVDTIPPETMDAFRDHGVVQKDALRTDLAGAHADLAALGALGVDLADITRELVVDGVKQFAAAFDKLYASIAQRRLAAGAGGVSSLRIAPGSKDAETAFEAELETWRADGKIRRLWAMDASLWTSTDESRWGGWLTIVDQELADVGDLEAFADEVKRDGVTDVVLLGMGGSSLGPEVLSDTFGQPAGAPRFHMLDATDPAQVRAVEAAVALETSLFIVQSKSGSTLEPNIFTDYFFDRVRAVCGQDRAGRQFVAVTDPGSSMETRAQELGFRRIFHGAPSIGGRYSVLSKFGLVPAAVMGVDVRRLLQAARVMALACGADVPPHENPGVRLGVALGVAASKLGRDKVTIIASPGIRDVGAWLEQLLAESTGKQGKGLIPVDGEPVASPDLYGTDRIFVHLALEGAHDDPQDKALEVLSHAGHPVVFIKMADVADIGQEFFRWEIATAVAGAVIGINPFDQPDVEASKQKTRALTDAYVKSRARPQETPLFSDDVAALFADPRNAAELGSHSSLVDYLRSHFARLRPGDYAAVLAYLERNQDHIDVIQEMREAVRDHTRAATCVGFGPRFQHSTGQAYKGGPNTGVFLQITAEDASDLEVPGRGFSFGVVKAAQAQGDLEVLNERGRRTVRAHLKDVDTGLAALARAVRQAVS